MILAGGWRLEIKKTDDDALVHHNQTKPRWSPPLSHRHSPIRHEVVFGLFGVSSEYRCMCRKPRMQGRLQNCSCHIRCWLLVHKSDDDSTSYVVSIHGFNSTVYFQLAMFLVCSTRCVKFRAKSGYMSWWWMTNGLDDLELQLRDMKSHRLPSNGYKHKWLA